MAWRVMGSEFVPLVGNLNKAHQWKAHGLSNQLVALFEGIEYMTKAKSVGFRKKNYDVSMLPF